MSAAQKTIGGGPAIALGRRMTKSRFSCLALTALALGCGGPDETDRVDQTRMEIPPIEPPALEGQWRGSTDDGGAVIVEVGPGEVLSRVSIELEVSVGNGTCTGVFEAQPDAMIASGEARFEGTLSNAGGTVDGIVTLTFDGETVTGAYDVNSFAL